jgi:hypothetical protein
LDRRPGRHHPKDSPWETGVRVNPLATVVAQADLGVKVLEWRSRIWPGPSGDFDLEMYWQRATPIEILDDHAKEEVGELRNKFLLLYQGCQNKGGYTADIIEFMDKYGVHSADVLPGTDKLTEEVFGISFSTKKQ